ncbi:MAG: hypothetical protein Q4F60_03045 [Candidatus Saccharibacteria bacterium]|nr:hypothetical protein [Candidatus Saccharibacteria bacterium]
MDNKEIYKKTISFSLRRLLWDIFSVIIFVIIAGIGFLIAEQATNKGLIGLGIGAILGGIVMYLISRYVSYSYKAGQIAMMTQAVTEGKLPDDVIAAGKKTVKEHFSTVAAYFAITGVIKGIFQQIGQGITAVGKAVGGNNGETIGSVISSVIQTIVAYLCDCCLGWVFYRKDEKPAKATLEGAVLFFKNGKTLLKNLGRVFGMGLAPFLIIGGVFTGIFYLIMLNFPDFFANLSSEIIEAAARAETTIPDFISDINSLTLFCAFLGGVCMWSFLHSAFVRPFVLVGVLRNFIEAGKKNIPNESDFVELDKKSSKFKKLHSEL